MRVSDGSSHNSSECRVPCEIAAVSPVVKARMQYERAGKLVKRRELPVKFGL